jgi:hypothetical protein
MDPGDFFSLLKPRNALLVADLLDGAVGGDS